MNINDLKNLADLQKSTETMPALFIGHGTPMNAIENNEFTQAWKKLGKSLPTPKAILCISAHWETKGTFVTAMEKPKTIHDFGGFPCDLYQVQYPANGNPILATEIQKNVINTYIGHDHDWGLDHGTWSILKHIYPEANIPVLQLSIDYTKDAEYHYNLAKELTALRNKGVLIIGSGNMIHNLRMARVTGEDFNAESAYDWAIEINEKMKREILSQNHQQLINYQELDKHWQLAIPTTDHYYPLLYTLALQGKNEDVTIFNDKTVAGSLSMTSILIK